MRALPRTAALAAGLLVASLSGAFPPGPARAQGGADGTCPRDVLVAQSMQRQAVDQLEEAGSDPAESCRVWRRHVDTMRRVAGVYARCLSGTERVERLAQVQGSEREFAGAIRSRCR